MVDYCLKGHLPPLDWSEGFIGTQEEQRKRGVNPETRPGEHLLGSGLL